VLEKNKEETKAENKANKRKNKKTLKAKKPIKQGKEELSHRSR